MDMKWTDAWQQLVYEHTPFRAVDDDDFQDLLRQAGALEQLFLNATVGTLRAYYDEWAQGDFSAAARADAKERRAPAPQPETIHVATMQLQLMEDAFYSLRLDRYANAPDNRGWMNLFRRWGNSPTFKFHVDQLEDTFSRQFVEFFHHYIEDWPTDVPVPHPWDVRPAARKQAVPFAGVTMQGVQQCIDPERTGKRGKGIFLDPGRVEAGPPQDFEEPTPVRREPDIGGEAAGRGGSSGPPAPAVDSSNSTA